MQCRFHMIDMQKETSFPQHSDTMLFFSLKVQRKKSFNDFICNKIWFIVMYKTIRYPYHDTGKLKSNFETSKI